MAISPSSSVRQARAALAQRLREIRLDAGLTAQGSPGAGTRDLLVLRDQLQVDIL